MSRTRCFVAVGLCVLLERLWPASLTLGGTAPPLLPGLLCLLGGKVGAGRGAECGFFAGGLCVLAGGSVGLLPLWTLLGGLAGRFHPPCGGVGRIVLRCLPLIALSALLEALGHWLFGPIALSSALTLASLETALAILLLPLTALLQTLCALTRSPRRRQKAPRFSDG